MKRMSVSAVAVLTVSCAIFVLMVSAGVAQDLKYGDRQSKEEEGKRSGLSASALRYRLARLMRSLVGQTISHIPNPVYTRKIFYVPSVTINLACWKTQPQKHFERFEKQQVYRQSESMYWKGLRGTASHAL